MAFIDSLLEKAKKAGKTIVLCEGEDKRVVEAASKIVKDGIAKIILVGNEEECKKVAPGVDLRTNTQSFCSRQEKEKLTRKLAHLNMRMLLLQRLISRKTAQCSVLLCSKLVMQMVSYLAHATQRQTQSVLAFR